MPKPSLFTIISALFLVAGTSIGGGMLALPLATGLNGFVPSIVIMAICWLAMMTTALLLLEVTLWFSEGAHIITMTSHILGRFGKWIAAIVYLFICYASIVAYTAGGGIQIATLFDSYLQMPLSKEWGSVIFMLLFYAVIFMGSAITGRINTMLFVAMILAYFALVVSGLDEINPPFLERVKWSGSFMAIPLLLTSFSFQTMVPSLVPYLKMNLKAIRCAIVGGTFLTFLIYIVWQALILGIIPVEGPHGLAAALAAGEPATLFIQHHVDGQWVATLSHYFAFFAIATSFLGITFGLFDFIADGLGLQKQGRDRWIISLLIVIPTLFCALKLERVFYLAMDTSGGFGDAILNGMIPVLLIWIGRYKLGYKSPSPLPVGKIFLGIVFLFYLSAMTIEILDRVGIYEKVKEAYDVLKIENKISKTQ